MSADRITDHEHAHAVRTAHDVVARAFTETTKRPQVTSFFDESTNTASHVVRSPASRRCAVIDSVLDYDAASGRTATESADELIAFIREHRLEVEWVIETHVHADHLSAAPYIKERLGGALGIGEQVRVVQKVFGKVFNAGTEFQRDGSQFDHLFVDGERFTIGELDAVAMHTPGHTPDCMTYVIGDAAFVGDTLFMPDYGTARADFPGGDARALYRSVRRVLSLPGETRLFLCHDYKASGRNEFRWETTVAAERVHNVHMHDGVSEDEFVRMRTARDAQLGMPKLILPSVQVNMRAGEFPPAEGDGLIDLPQDSLEPTIERVGTTRGAGVAAFAVAANHRVRSITDNRQPTERGSGVGTEQQMNKIWTGDDNGSPQPISRSHTRPPVTSEPDQ